MCYVHYENIQLRSLLTLNQKAQKLRQSGSYVDCAIKPLRMQRLKHSDYCMSMISALRLFPTIFQTRLFDLSKQFGADENEESRIMADDYNLDDDNFAAISELAI
jgi:hypothetical protein